MRSLASWCFRHRRIVLASWIVGAIVMTLLHGAIGSDYKDTFDLKKSDSADAINLLKGASKGAAGDTDQIVFQAKSGKVTDPANQAKLEAMLTKVSTMPHVAALTSPFTPQGSTQISKDGTVAYATVNFDLDAAALPIEDGKAVTKTAQAAGSDNLKVALGGQAIQQSQQQGGGGTGEGILLALVVLLIVFGSLLAAVLPLIAAGFALGIGVAVIGLFSNVITMASFSSQLALLIGLGVGVDYALFIVTRYRQALMRGETSEQAVVRAIDTSGRAVLFAGITVCIALLGMFALGVSFLYGVAIAASIVVMFTVFTALTLLPALLGFFGNKVLPRKMRKALKAGEYTTSDESAGWSRWAGVLQKRPALFAVGATVLMLIIAIPFLSIRLGSSDSGSDPADTTTRQAYDMLATGFGPGFNGPLQLVANVDEAGAEAQFKTVAAAVGEDPDVVSMGPVTVIPGEHGKVAIAQAFPKGSPQDESTTDLVHRLRDSVVPQAEDGAVNVHVGGNTAIFVDFASTLSSKLPLFIGVVVLLSFLLLMAVFRSVLIPLMAAAANLLSVGAAFGLITAVFQWGWAGEIIGIDRTGPIEAFVPVMVFAILFGLSMDYEVFLMSRIYEEWHKRKDNREAIIHGLAATGRTITAAAAIMVLVFAAFILGGERIIKLFGLGLAGAVLMDAIIVRSALIPGLMLWIGKANWWLPGWLDRILPKLNVEGAGDEPLDPTLAEAPEASPVIPIPATQAE
jgi:RND superfamily putative drug exporter